MSLNFQDQSQKEKIKEIQRKAEEERAKRRALELNLPYLDLRLTPINPDSLALISKEKSLETQIGIFQKKDQKILVASFNPEDEKTKKVLEELKSKNYSVEIFIVSLSSLKNWVWPNYREVVTIEAKTLGEVKISPQTIADLKIKLINLKETKKNFDNLKDKNTTQIIELILAASLANRASDIHLQPEKENARIRFRIDGLLEDIKDLDQEIYRQLKNRLKLISNLSLNIVDVPQDGRFTIKVDTEIEVRVSTLPGGYGEGIVMRVLDPKAISVPLEELGFFDFQYQMALEEINKPNGMIILTGPTGSGKTTTLYGFINKLNSPEVKIITVEDPIEYKLAGVSQTQIEPEKGLTFAAALRAILRQDPDIVLIGEMRDKETAEIALQASLTGHMVFSTLHTNEASGAITRLIDIGAKTATIAPALNLIIAQRLLRKLCEKCKEPLPAKEIDLEKLTKELNNIKKDILDKFPQISKDLRLYKARGCQFCNNGYKGRTAIHEMLRNSEAIKNLIIKDPNQFEVKKIALKEGMITLRQSGFLKTLMGITTIEETEGVTSN